jgi:hypothetical protein
MKYCSECQYEQIFFKYIPIRCFVFEKMCADGVVCSSLGLNEFTCSPPFSVVDFPLQCIIEFHSRIWEIPFGNLGVKLQDCQSKE